jgi:threonine/homoserine/homoserine lactone efflux protein
VDYLAFSIVMLLGQFSPGPDMLLLMRNALSLPLRTALCTVLGIATGLAIHTALALGGVSLLLRNSPGATRALGIAGGLYLGWLAFRLLRSAWSSSAARPSHGTAATPPRTAFLQGFLTNLLNPKAVIFLASVLAAMLGPEPSTPRRLAFWAIVIGQALVFWSTPSQGPSTRSVPAPHKHTHRPTIRLSGARCVFARGV